LKQSSVGSVVYLKAMKKTPGNKLSVELKDAIEKTLA